MQLIVLSYSSQWKILYVLICIAGGGFCSLACFLSQTDRYVLGIQARDSGTPMLYSNVAVNISVEDLNDNPPLFDHLNYTATVQVRNL